MGMQEKKVAIKLTTNGAYFKNFVEGQSKSPLKGFAITSTSKPHLVPYFAKNDTEFVEITSQLIEAGIEYILVEEPNTEV